MSTTYFGGVWSSLKFNAGNAFSGSSLDFRIKNTDSSQLTYKNPRYKSVLVHIGKQLVMSQLEGELHKLLPKFKKNVYKNLREDVLEQQQKTRDAIIKNKQAVENRWGIITTDDEKTISAKDKYGIVIPEALILHYKGDTQLYYYEKTVLSKSSPINDSNKSSGYQTNEIVTTEVCHIDLAPSVTISSSKNLVMTQVQGRDYTRKELVSGGDLSFQINGGIVSNDEGIYPTDAVQRFVKIMQYGGVVDISYFLLGQLNVEKVIIKDWNLGDQKCKNIQPYSFNCVAIEPDNEFSIAKDTISSINREIQLSPMNKMYDLILNDKLGQMATSLVTNAASSAVTQGVGIGLDKLVPNI